MDFLLGLGVWAQSAPSYIDKLRQGKAGVLKAIRGRSSSSASNTLAPAAAGAPVVGRARASTADGEGDSMPNKAGPRNDQAAAGTGRRSGNAGADGAWNVVVKHKKRSGGGDRKGRGGDR